MITEQEIRQHLTTKIFGQTIYCFDTIDSTNIFAKSLMTKKFGEGSLVFAEHQTGGKGRHGRIWQSEREKNLTFSILLKPNITPEHIGVISLYAGLAVTEAVQDISSVVPECKWPNDVLLNKKKICGILSESILRNDKLAGVIIGIGLNVNQQHFPPSLESTASSIALMNGHAFDRAEVLALILKKLELNYEFLQQGEVSAILRKWQNHTTMFGKKIKVDQQGEILSGIAHSLDLDGGLILKHNGIDEKILAGDVTIVDWKQ